MNWGVISQMGMNVDRLRRDIVKQTEEEYFFELLGKVSYNSNSQNRKQGAILVKEGSIISTGSFDAYPLTVKVQEDVRESGSGAIENAIANCAKLGISTRDATLYTFLFPNDMTCKLIVRAGISEIRVAKPFLTDSLGANLCKEKHVKVFFFEKKV